MASGGLTFRRVYRVVTAGKERREERNEEKRREKRREEKRKKRRGEKRRGEKRKGGKRRSKRRGDGLLLPPFQSLPEAPSC